MRHPYGAHCDLLTHVGEAGIERRWLPMVMVAWTCGEVTFQCPLYGIDKNKEMMSIAAA
jgi:hypothetical protein